MKKIINYVIIVLLLISITTASVLLWHEYSLNKNGEEFVELSKILRQQTEVKEKNEDSSKEILSVSSGFSELKKTNDDLVGWLTIEGTPIDLPIMFTPEFPEYYLRRNFNKDYSISGTPFIDERCILEPQSSNIIIYGHKMRDKSMFSTLSNYKDNDYFINHPTISFYTEVSTQIYKVFGIIETEIYSDTEFNYYAMLDTKAKFDLFVKAVKDNSLNDVEMNVEYGDKLISLSTCILDSEIGRFIVVGKLVDTITNY
jgi:sortase B